MQQMPACLSVENIVIVLFINLGITLNKITDVFFTENNNLLFLEKRLQLWSSE